MRLQSQTGGDWIAARGCTRVLRIVLAMGLCAVDSATECVTFELSLLVVSSTTEDRSLLEIAAWTGNSCSWMLSALKLLPIK